VDRRYVEATAAWHDDRIADAEFLAATRRAYDYWIRRYLSPAWRTFRRVLRDLDMDHRHVVFTNLARCQLPKGDTQPVIRACQRWYPMSALVAAVRPAAVFCASKFAYAGGKLAIDWGTDLAFAFDYYTGRGVNGGTEQADVWIPRAVALIRARLASEVA
jgi:hypothetical protein